MKTQLAILRKDGWLSSHPDWTREQINDDLSRWCIDEDDFRFRGAKIVEIRIVQPKKKGAR
jgi:hypothetical protein